MELTKLWSKFFLLSFLLILQIFFLEFSISTDTIRSAQFIKDPNFIISSGDTFKFGFFSPPNTTNRYVGILYNIPIITPIWVANRNDHLNDSEGSITISENGNLVILDGQNRTIWSSSLSNISNSTTTTTAQILDTGNLVLRDNSSENTLWESFKNPSDCFLESMEISEMTRLTSWKSPFDPSNGTFSFGVDTSNIPQVMIWNNSQPYWRSGPWNNRIFIGLPKMESNYLDRFNFDKQEGTLTFAFANASLVRYFRLNSYGKMVNRFWYEGQEDWGLISEIPEDECDIYGKCGPFGTCQMWKDQPVCSCLKGFKPKNLNEWDAQNFTGGCERKTLLKCDRNSGNEEGNIDIFSKLSRVKVPDSPQFYSNGNEDDCKHACLSKCSCIAYSSYTAIGCMHWNTTLIDIKRFSANLEGVDVYIRLAYSERDKKKNMDVLIIVTTLIGFMIFSIGVFFFWKWMNKRKVTMQESEVFPERGGFYEDDSCEMTPSRAKVEELPLFTFNDLAIATQNFHLANKLGQGGFGTVYKGKLSHGKEIAVKRLSQSSGQGQEEFMSEVVVMSKLQHRNLVRLLGCCVEKEEKILVYEYMPNRSLDTHLFDKVYQEHLDWPKRVKIIEGICRGLLYMHRDSRLKIIHRDLKPSNILLDMELNPKISDFGMARIFGGNQNQANTKRIVGTYGYMSPEYATEGRFSEKSDVFSLGVLLLEIVSGKRNISFYHDEFTVSLIGYAWKLWKEENISEFIDPRISNHCFETEVLRYIHVGLSCVQEFAEDRPNISLVLSMLSKEIDNLPILKKPAFTKKQAVMEDENPHQIQENISSNDVSVSLVIGR